MLNTVSPQPTLFYEDQGGVFDVAYLIGLFKRQILYFAVPFLALAMIGYAVTKIQTPIYRAEGKILVESSGISTDLLRPTVTELIDQRFEVLKQRILTPDNLLATVDKFNLFAGVRNQMSGFQLLEQMRNRVAIKPVPLEMQPGAPTTAFSVSFDYEAPELALQVVNEFLSKILAEDSSRRASSATETANLLEDQVKKLQGQYDAVLAQLESIKQRPIDQQEAVSEEQKAQLKSLTDLQAELVQKSSSYSDQHPAVKKLKTEIAALKQMIATTPQKAPADKAAGDKNAIAVLQQQEALLGRSLEDARNKLAMARLGEGLEKNQQADHMQIIQYPELPGKPVRPKKLQWYAIALALAAAIGAATAFLAETLDGTIRGKKELTRFIEPRLIVTIPYVSKPGEQLRRRAKMLVLLLVLVGAMGAATAAFVTRQSPVDFATLSSMSR